MAVCVCEGGGVHAPSMRACVCVLQVAVRVYVAVYLYPPFAAFEQQAAHSGT
jgi:hypothetical protein